MKISIIGTNGMLSSCITKGFYEKNNIVDVYGLEAPADYSCSNFTKINLLNDNLDYGKLLDSDIIVYTAGAGVQAALNTESTLMYSLNLNIPIEITIQLKKYIYKGIYISFGSYMEIGLNGDDKKVFKENEVVCSPLPVTNDYALSKRLYSRYMNDFKAEYTYWHFILPNMFSYDDVKPGTRLIPYVLSYLIDYNNELNQKKPSFSAGLQTRQYISMEEILIVINKAIEISIPSGIYNVGGGEFISIRKLIERLFTLYNVPIENDMFDKEMRRDGDIKSLKLEGSKLFEQINYLPNKRIEDILC
jgi:nucleoside-diphosphate-sugar epimerase